MKIALAVCMFAAACVSALPGPAAGQSAAPVIMPRAHLTLSSEVATTTDEGYPSSLRVTLTNAGDMAVSMPLLMQGCGPSNGVQVMVTWVPSGSSNQGLGTGRNCGTGHQPLYEEWVRNEWLRLRPGEFMTITVALPSLSVSRKSGTTTYWVEFVPPDATPQVLNDLWRDGFLIPTEKLRTKEASFQIP
ncbi:MAG: hypothetical protein ACLGSD_02155 [Acidobacteriota bacterium]